MQIPVAPYSLRGRTHPTVAAPRTWAELSEPGLRQLDYREVLERVGAGIDPLAGLLVAHEQRPAAAVGAPAASRRPTVTAGNWPPASTRTAPSRPAHRGQATAAPT